MIEYIKLVAVSFTCSIGLAIVFRVDRKNLIAAGFGGALTRCVYLFMCAMTDTTFFQFLIPAIVAAMYAEIMAMSRKMPSTVLLYPSIIPLLPGSTLYYIAVNMILGDKSATMSYIWECTISLGGICLGFVLTSTFRYYRQIYFLGEHVGGGLKKLFRGILRLEKRKQSDGRP